MVTISLCMIVKNEEHVLARCLDSVHHLVDEINIVDTGSTDETIAIAEQYTDRVFQFEWNGTFKDARNESFSYATQAYIFYLDADDVLLEKDQEKFKSVKESLDSRVDSVSMYYNAGLDEFDNVTLYFRRNRLVKRIRHFKWEGDCHNYLAVSGQIINSDVAITHKKTSHSVGRNLSIYETKIKNGDTFTPRDFFYYGNELRENGYYKQAIDQYTIHINMEEGWVEDKFYACINRADCYRMLGEADQELSSLLESFKFSGSPRPETCSRIGFHFQQKKKYDAAIFLYELATMIKTDPNKWSFTYPAYATWYPHLQLCVCYYHIQDYKASYKHNEKALLYRPNDERMVNNKKMLEKLAM